MRAQPVQEILGVTEAPEVLVDGQGDDELIAIAGLASLRSLLASGQQQRFYGCYNLW
jgi:hypothetical protein